MVCINIQIMSKTSEEKKINKKLESIRCLGECKCGGKLIISTLAPKSERFTVSCTECGSVSDIRFPKKGDVYVLTSVDDNPIKLLCRVYEQEKIIISDHEIESTPISSLVNKLHGEV